MAGTANAPATLTGDQSDQWDLLRQLGGGAPAATSVRGSHDEFTVAATPETEFQLTYIPVDGTCAMYVNGLEQREGTDYTVDYDSGLVTFVTALTTGDEIDFRYLITDWLVARSLPPDVGSVQFDNFNRADNAADINPASDGGTYDDTLLTSSVYGVSSNRGYIPTAANMFDVVVADCGSLDTDVQITNIRANTATASILWFCLDYTNATVDGYGLEFDSDSSFVHIIDYRTATQRESPVIILNTWTGGSSTLRVTFNHTTGLTTIYQDGVNSWSHVVSGALSTGSGAGFGSNSDSATAGEFWEDFTAQPL